MIRLWTLGAASVTDAHGNAVDTVATQSKRFALLVYLALARPRGWHRRDILLALFWPELDQARARHALRQALHFLRKTVGDDVVQTRGSEDLAAGPGLWCDAAVFEDGEATAENLALYRGDLLPGFFIRGASPEWDQWMDGRRAALSERALALRDRAAPPADAAAEATPRPTPRADRGWWWTGVAAAAAVAAALVSTWLVPRSAQARSTLADSLYDRGLATLQSHGDNRAALGWFEAALQASPRFPLAAYYAGVSADAIDETLARRWFARAEELLPHATEHDRLVIETATAFRRDSPVALATAESLASRYSADPLGHHLYASALLWSGDFAGAVREFRRELDVTPLDSAGVRCTTCEALEGMAVSLQFLDSLSAAERVVQGEIRLMPRSGRAWATLATIQAAEDHVREARASGRHAAELLPGHAVDPLASADLDIRAGDFTAADRTLRDALTYGTRDGRESARWLLVISLRNQGRLLEALRVAREYRRDAEDSLGPIPVAQVLFELGRTQEAALLFDSIAAPPAGGRAAASGVAARVQAWALAHAAEAWAALGDTSRVKADADTIAQLSRRSLYGRDSHLPPHFRGLVWLARGQPDSALPSLRRAVFSLSIGYTRTNLVLGRVLLSAGRAREAATVATAGLAEAVDGSAYYATRTELHELAARAFEAAGEPDSAARHYAVVAKAWAQADPLLAPRAAFARDRVTILLSKGPRGLD